MQISRKKPHKGAAKQYFFGVFLSLQSLYAILLIIKSFGHTVGWGFQLQSPLMIQSLIVLFLILFLASLNLIIIQAPSFIRNYQSSNMILSGILTTIIATPCTAPFLGAALSVALFQSFLIGLLIFSMIAIGLALPMMIIIAFPKSSAFLPKSGQWATIINGLFSIGFGVTIGWLTWILNAQISNKHMAIFYGCIILVLIALIIKNKQRLSRLIIAPLLITIIAISLSLYPNPSPQKWQPFNAVQIQSLEQNNTPYFIDITAKWCITCQTNKLTTLNTKKTNTLFEKNNITLIRADWTNNNPEITDLLHRFNQVSIPTYIYFNGTSHQILGNIITINDIERLFK